MNFGSRIKAARKAAGLSQEAVARRADMSLNGFADIERGLIADPHYSTLQKIAGALGVPITTLVGESAPKAQAPSPSETAEEERRAEHALIRVWADLIKSFRDRFVDFVDALPESPDTRTAIENTVHFEHFDSEFSSMEQALIKAGAAEFFMRYVNAQQVRATGRGLPDLTTREEADEILEQTPADVARAVQEVRGAKGDILIKLAKARVWVSAHNPAEEIAADIDRRAEQWEEELRTRGLLETPALGQYMR